MATLEGTVMVPVNVRTQGRLLVLVCLSLSLRFPGSNQYFLLQPSRSWNGKGCHFHGQLGPQGPVHATLRAAFHTCPCYVIDPVKAVSIIGLVLELSFLDCPIFQAPHPAMFLSLVIPRFLLWTLPKPCPWSPQAQSSLFLVVSGRFSPSASFHSNVSVRTASDVPVSAS